MNLSIKNSYMNNSIHGNSKITKTNFKGNGHWETVPMSEHEIIEKIKTMPKRTPKENEIFINFCNSVKLTPNIAKAIQQRLSTFDEIIGQIRQSKEVIDSSIASIKQVGKNLHL